MRLDERMGESRTLLLLWLGSCLVLRNDEVVLVNGVLLCPDCVSSLEKGMVDEYDI